MMTIAHSPSSPFNTLIYHRKWRSVTMVTIIFPLLSFEIKKGGVDRGGQRGIYPQGGNVMGRRFIVTIVTIVTHPQNPPIVRCDEMQDEGTWAAHSEGEKQ